MKAKFFHHEGEMAERSTSTQGSQIETAFSLPLRDRAYVFYRSMAAQRSPPRVLNVRLQDNKVSFKGLDNCIVSVSFLFSPIYFPAYMRCIFWDKLDTRGIANFLKPQTQQ